jgi:hypothetical protein
MDDDLVQALRLRGVDVETALEAGMTNHPDDEHLAHASAAGRVIYTFNVGDFMRLHGEYTAAGKAHASIIFGDQQRYGVGEQMRRLRRITAIRSAEAMQNSYEFLSAWQ